MNNHIKTILFSLTAVLLFASLLQQATGFCKVKELKGVVSQTPKPDISIQNFRTGKLQKGLENYLQQHYGFREPLTRLYNQYLWSLFHFTQVEEDKRILISDDNWIFEPWSVEEFYQSRSYRFAEDSLEMVNKMEAEVLRLYQLQHILEPHGTHLFVALLPGKELICDEHMPKNKEFFEKKQITAADYYSKRFVELGINHVNFADWFVQIQDTVNYPLFPQTGTHWSNYASMHVADSLIRYMEWLGDVNLMNLEIGQPYEKTLYPDDDLESLMNLIWPLKKAPNYMADVRFIPDSTAVKPKLITIGDSFYWNLVNKSSFGTPFSAFPYWFYFSSAYFSGSNTNVSQIDVLDEVLSSDFVMLSYSTAPIYGMSNGFSEKMLMELCYDQGEIDARVSQIRQAIESDNLWKDRVFQQALDKGRNYDQELTSEINLMIFNNLKEYFPALCDSIPTKRSLRGGYLMGDSLAFVEWNVKETLQSIKDNPERMNEERQKALDRGLDIETMLLYDARWIVDYKIKNGILTYPGKPKTM